jgi:predicted dehydrogenase
MSWSRARAAIRRRAEPAVPNADEGAVTVGVVGCGVVAREYVEGSRAFPTFDVVACADVDSDRARMFAETHGLQCFALEELFARGGVDVILNLTPPAAHADVIAATLDAGKHSYTEKPLALSVDVGRALVEQAATAGLRLGCAPDTFLGSAYQLARRVIDRGDIGIPIGASAQMLTGGPENWHPNAEFFYRSGGGPVLDIAPYYLTAMVSLLGPIAATSAFAATPTIERELRAGPRAGERFVAEVPTHAAAALRFASAALATITVSFEMPGRYESGMVVYGTERSLRLPDANKFGGDVMIRSPRSDWEALAYEPRPEIERRGIGLHDLVEAMHDGRPHQASAELALHVLDATLAMLRSAEEGITVPVESLPAPVA